MKSLKRKEIEDKIEKLKKTTGINDLKLSVEDLDKDFDPDEYEKQIEVFIFFALFLCPFHVNLV